MIRTALVLGVTVLAHSTTLGHGGGLNAEGCHTNKKTGDYHCHGGGAPKVKPATEPKASLQTLASPAAAGAQANSRKAPTCYVGPRGGTYTITASGKKNYGGC